MSNMPLISLSPTDLSQYFRLGRCERFLAIRVRERSGINVFAEYGVAPHPVSPLLRSIGEVFEAEVVERVARHVPTIHCGEATDDGRPRGADNQRIIDAAERLAVGESIVFVQPAVVAQFRHGTRSRTIQVFGNIDVLRLFRNEDGICGAEVVDVKRSAEARLDHHLQAALYALVVENLLSHSPGSTSRRVTTAILRARRESDTEDAGAEPRFGCGDIAVLETTPNPEAYRWVAEDFLLSPDSMAEQVASTSIPEAMAVLTVRCDGCVNQEICHVVADVSDDLCLIPGLTAREKRVLVAEGVRTLTELVAATSSSEKPTIEHKSTPLSRRIIARLGATYPGLIRRAKATARMRGQSLAAEAGIVQEVRP